MEYNIEIPIVLQTLWIHVPPRSKLPWIKLFEAEHAECRMDIWENLLHTAFP